MKALNSRHNIKAVILKPGFLSRANLKLDVVDTLFLNDLLAVKYMETLGKVADGKASKIFLPLETSGVMGSIAGIAELFKDKKEENKK